MIKRDILKELKILLKEYPIVTLLGPRQAGKTTLVKEFLKGYEYSNLESPEVRSFALEDPKAFLSQFKSKVILDEIQRVPELLSYIQVSVDNIKKNGQYILTGSHQLALQEAVTQSLAGRTAIINLMPFSISELTKSNKQKKTFQEYCHYGFLPRIYDQNQRPLTAYSNYYKTYIERDVKLLINLKDLSIFEKFFKLLAGRVGQLIDYSSLANDAGVDAKTIKNWLSILEASFIVYKLNPYFENFGKRVIKSPKYYFTDVGLLCFILGITNQDQITRDPLVGNIFENLIVMECLKNRYNKGLVANMYFYRDSNKNEVDLIIQDGRNLIALEIKSSSTFSSNLLKELENFKTVSKQVKKSFLVYAGETKKLSNNTEVINFNDLGSKHL
jgi:predicted AAA+ superfamily ATPase